MNTLYIDTHDKKIVFAYYQNEKLIRKKEREENQDHSRICISTLEEFLKEIKKTIQDIQDIVVVSGPGLFTGVRLGVTIAKTLAYTLNIPIRSLTSLECFLPVKEEVKYLAMKEKNGYFLGKLNYNRTQIEEYQYITKEEYQKQTNCIEKEEINYEELIHFAHQKEPLNPHQVNPFYVKKIEVEE